VRNMSVEITSDIPIAVEIKPKGIRISKYK
jgi:hypothetical protein